MSYTNETTHYGIPLPLGSDKTTPMDYNNSAQEIDTNLFNAVTNSTAGLNKANAVEEALGDTNDELAGVKGRVTTLEGTVTTQGGAIQQNSTRIEEVEDDALDMICAVDEGTAQVATVAVEEGKYFRYNNVLYMATTDIAIGDTIVPNTNCRATNVATELESISPSGEVVDTTARQGVSTNASHIGNLSALETTVKSNLVAAINEVLGMIGGGGMPVLDFANPLHTFSTNNLSYTATKDCYIAGYIGLKSGGGTVPTTPPTLIINSTEVAVGNIGIFGSGSSYAYAANIPIYKIKSGDIVSVNVVSEGLHVFDEA